MHFDDLYPLLFIPKLPLSPFHFFAYNPFEGSNHFGIELFPGFGYDLLQCLPGQHAFAVGAGPVVIAS
jgi:hypothetical protein